VKTYPVPNELSLWIVYVDILVVWPHGTDKLWNFLIHLNITSSIQFTTEIELYNVTPFLGVLVIRKGTILVTKVQRKPTHIHRYLNFKSNPPPHLKQEITIKVYKRQLLLHAKNA
jgi:hypothetical protein